MLFSLFLCMWVSAVHSYDVKVIVSEPLCLDIYYRGPGGANTMSQLFMELSLTSASEYFPYVTMYLSRDSVYSFYNSDNVLWPWNLTLNLGRGTNLFSGLSTLDDITLVLKIVPLLKWVHGDEVFEKCATEVVQSLSLSPSKLFQTSNHTASSRLLFHLKNISCLNASANACQASTSTIEVELNCHGPCENLLAANTTTTSQLSTSGLESTITNTADSMTSTTTTPREAGADKPVGGMAGIGVLAALEFIIILGLSYCLLRKYRPNVLNRRSTDVGPTGQQDPVVYYDGADHWINGPLDNAPHSNGVSSITEPDDGLPEDEKYEIV